MSKVKDHPYKQFLNGWDPKSKLEGELTGRALQDFQASGLSPETLERHGVRLYKGNQEDLRSSDKLGFATVDGQSILKARRLIEIPYHDSQGNVIRYEYKCIPEVYFKTDKKSHKYLQAKGKPPTPYIPPSTWQARDKAKIPIWISEGAKKILKLVQHSRAAIGISGTPNWKAGKDSNLSDSKDLWADLKAFKWSGRTVFIAFDMDLWTNPQVRRDLYGLAFALFVRGAMLRFPSWTIGKGIDDHLAQHENPETALNQLEAEARDLEGLLCIDHREEIRHAITNLKGTDRNTERTLIKIIADKLKLKPSDLKTEVIRKRADLLKEKVKDSIIDGCYIHEDGGVYRIVSTREGEVEVKLSNFVARIVEDQLIDDGIEEKRQFQIEVKTASAVLPRLSLPTKDFPSLSWTMQHCGNIPIIEPGQTKKDELRAFFQKHSAKEGITYRTIYKHTGWRYINSQWVFLHAGGALGSKDISVELDADYCKSGHYRLPDEPRREREAISLIFNVLFEVANPEIIFPLLAFTFLTPLKSFLNSQPGFSLFCYGLPDSFKTSIAILSQGFFGSTTKEGLANFSSTILATLKRAAILKDVICIVDDHHPSPSRKDHEKREEMIERLIRDVGNNQGRSRLNADASTKATHIPKAGIIITGELLPTLQSTLSRFITLDFSKDAVNIDNLTQVQAQADLLPYAMTSFILWVKDHITSLQADFSAQFQELRGGYVFEGKSRKLPEHAAFLMYAWTVFLQWAHEKGAINQDLKAGYLDMGRGIFAKVCSKHAKRIDQENPVKLFFGTIGSIITDKLARLDHLVKDGKDKTVVSYEGHIGEGKAKPIGYFDDKLYYFLPGSVWHIVREYLSREFTHFPISNKHVFYETLEKEDYLDTIKKGQHTSTHWINGASLRVLKVYKSKVDELLNLEGIGNGEVSP